MELIASSVARSRRGGGSKDNEKGSKEKKFESRLLNIQ